jgi:hypothetical protein
LNGEATEIEVVPVVENSAVAAVVVAFPGFADAMTFGEVNDSVTAGPCDPITPASRPTS